MENKQCAVGKLVYYGNNLSLNLQRAIKEIGNRLERAIGNGHCHPSGSVYQFSDAIGNGHCRYGSILHKGKPGQQVKEGWHQRLNSPRSRYARPIVLCNAGRVVRDPPAQRQERLCLREGTHDTEEAQAKQSGKKSQELLTHRGMRVNTEACEVKER